MERKILVLFLYVFLISLTSATLPVCSDINQQDISKVPCTGFTIPIACSGNVTVFNASDPEINFTIQTSIFTDNIYNFTFNFSNGAYNLIDCANNTALVEVKLLEQGFGINLFGIILPSIFLTIISLFISWKLFGKFREDDDEEFERKREENDSDSFMPKSRLIPIVFMLFAFIPMIFMTGFVDAHLEEYMEGSQATIFYGTFYIVFSFVFYFVFLISIIVWLSSFIKMKRMMKGLDDID